jgi:RNA polymerase sigma-70 factor (ECF subfamily)
MVERPDGRAAVEALWRESSARLRAWFERQTRSASDAEDLLQETFIRVHERLDTLRDALSLRAWVGTIARNVLRDHWRRRAAAQDEPEPAEPAAPLDEQGLDLTVAGWLEDFLGELDPEDARALRLADLEGRTQRELADVLGLSLSGAKSRVQRARARLRERLEACCTFAFDARGGILSSRRRSKSDCGEDCEETC